MGSVFIVWHRLFEKFDFSEGGGYLVLVFRGEKWVVRLAKRESG